MWDPTIGPTEAGAAIAGAVYLIKHVKDRMNGGTTRDRLIRIENNQEHYKEDLGRLEHRLTRLEDRLNG
jgi:hypothetical protein